MDILYLPDFGGPGIVLLCLSGRKRNNQTKPEHASFDPLTSYGVFFLQLVSVIHFISEDIPRCAISVDNYVTLSCELWTNFGFIFVTLFS